MVKHIIRISLHDIKYRLDKLISMKFNYMSREQVKSLIKNFYIRVNDNIVKSYSYKIKEKDNIIFYINTSYVYNISNSLKLYLRHLRIIYEDNNFVVIDKPGGICVYPGSVVNNYTNKSLINILMFYYSQLSMSGGKFRPGIVHRLDKNTSGLMLIARNDRYFLYLKSQMFKKTIKKLYHAIVYSTLFPKIGFIKNSLTTSISDRTRMQVSNNSNKKIAITYYRTIQSYENMNFSLVECDLVTGRTHQIRLHMHYKGVPIVGDEKYSKNMIIIYFSDYLLQLVRFLNRHLLHSKVLEFIHLSSGKVFRFVSHLDHELKFFLCSLSKDI